MFAISPNATCNNTLFSDGTIRGMTEEVHESAIRLYAAAKKVGVEGKSAVARLLNESPQAVNNWERRGVSEGGALKAQEKIGCDAVYILTGKGNPTPTGLRPELQEIAEAFSGFSEDQIAYVMELTRMAIKQAPRVGASSSREKVTINESFSSVRRKG